VARQCVLAANILLKRGDANAAKLLADIAGDDLLVVSLLIADGRKDGSRDTKEPTSLRASDLKILSECLKDTFPVLHNILEEFLRAKLPEELLVAEENLRLLQLQSPFAPLPFRMTKKSLGFAGRRTGMHVADRPLGNSWLLNKSALVDGTNEIIAAPAAAATSTAAFPWMKSGTSGGILGFIAAQQKVTQATRGGGLGPMTKLGVLAADSIDDLVGGRLFPEILVQSEENMGGLAALQKKCVARFILFADVSWRNECFISGQQRLQWAKMLKKTTPVKNGSCSVATASDQH
jgi:hypothetical protein